MNQKTVSIIMDLVQISTLLIFLFTGPVFTPNITVVALQIMALLIITTATWEMRRNKFYRVPDVGKQDHLVTGGIYTFIRHPMYTAQILFVATLLLNYFSLYRLCVFVVSTVNYLLKVRYEEKLLTKHFPQYQKYRKTSYRLIPFIY